MYPLKLYFRRLPNTLLICASLALNLALWTWMLWEIPKGDEPVFLHYNILFGVDYIGEWWRALALPFSGAVITAANVMIGWRMYERDPFFNYLFLTAGLLCQLFLLLGGALLILLNG